MSLLGHHHAHRQAVILLLGVVLTLAGLVAVASTARAATDPCGAGGNAIACENSEAGTSSDVWDIGGPGDDSIQGFSTDISVNVGSRIDFKIDTDASAYSITIYRTGWYGGDGAREIKKITPSARLPQIQPNCIRDATTELTDCGNWAVSASWDVPSTAVSGIYVALLTRPDTGAQSHITFIVRNDASHSDIVFQTSDPTWQAYNEYGGSDFYKGAANGRAYKVSYNRPVMTRNSPGGQDFYFANEYPLVRFLERNGYDVSYIAGVDTDRSGALLKNHQVFLSVGHDEYWSGAQRANVEAARDAGVNLQFLSGNEVYWRTRYEPSIDTSQTAYRTLVTYKEAWAQAKVDPSPQSTSTWRDPRYSSKANGGGLPENALTGTIFMSNYTDLPLTVTKAQGKLRLWRNTSLTSMTSASTALAPHTVGYESDEDQDNGFRPAGLIDLSTTTGNVVGQYMLDYGLITGDATTTHSLTLYRAPSGALVFGAGSVQWTWGLDDYHDTPYAQEAADQRMQQAQVNLLADMGVLPTTLMTGLTAASKSTDTTKPTATISTPAAGASLGNGAQVTVSGTASDLGGVVAGVEYSTDAGASWHPATGTTSWSFTYTQRGVGSTSLQVRAVDDSANIGTSVTRSFNVTCPCSVFGGAPLPTKINATAGPATAAVTDDASPVELGLRFTPLTDGAVTGVRFYKGTGNVGTHVGSLWSSAHEKLASATFTSETASGWQTVSFPSPVTVTAGETYVVSYSAPSGHYAVQPYAFSEMPLDAYPLTVDGGFGAQPAGVYGNLGKFPGSEFHNASYFVDAVFMNSGAAGLIAVSQWPAVNSSSVSASTTVSARFSKPIVASSLTAEVVDPNGSAVPGTTSYDATTRTVRFTPNAALSGFVKYTVTLSATATDGGDLTTGRTWRFTTARPPSVPGVCPCTLFDDDATPAVLDATDGNAITLGVRFTPTSTGVITGVRFYKSVTNTGAHLGAVWSPAGVQLASGTFTDESSEGWQTLTFANPVTVISGKTYTVSYYSPSGRWSATPNGFAAANLSRGPLTVGTSAGSYAYGNLYPAQSSSSNYYVDPVFEPRPPGITIATRSPASGALDVPRLSNVAVTFTNELKPGASLVVSAGGSALAGTTVLSPDATKLTFKPSTALPRATLITVQLSGVTSIDGASLAPTQWQFQTVDSDSWGPESVFDDDLPAVEAAAESSPVEVGLKVAPAADGTVSALRFFKGAGNGGTHVGSLWDATGQRLASVTFTNETSSGWQTAQLATPVAVSAGQTYVVSYFAPQGHYSYTYDYFTSDRQVGDIGVPGGNNGVYFYDPAGGLPRYSYRSANYFVDLVYTAAAATIQVTDRTPAAGATDVAASAHPSVTFSAPLAAVASMTLARPGASIAGSAALSADQRTLSFTPTAPLPPDTEVTVTVTGIASTRGATLGTQSWSFHTSDGVARASLFDGQVPANDSVSDGSPLELGVAFTPSVDGSIRKVRFYKGAANTGTHTGSIWSSSGELLAHVTFQNESATGWQEAALDTPLAVVAGQTYVVSYFSPSGVFAITPGFFDGPKTVGPLTALAANGRYTYSSGDVYPANVSGNGASYLVDVVFAYSS